MTVIPLNPSGDELTALAGRNLTSSPRRIPSPRPVSPRRSTVGRVLPYKNSHESRALSLRIDGILQKYREGQLSHGGDLSATATFGASDRKRLTISWYMTWWTIPVVEVR